MSDSATSVVPGESLASIDPVLSTAMGGAPPPPLATRRPPGRVRRALMRYVVPELALALLASLRRTWRIRETGLAHYERAIASGRAPLIAFLHGRSFMLLGTVSDRRTRSWFSMCSKSFDGDAMARLEERLGYRVVRGSSGRGGVQAIVDIIYAVRDNPGAGASLAVDGSRGPRGRVQGGIIALAQRTGGIVIPVTVSASSSWIFKRTWDRTLIAKPFARIEVVFGESLDVPAKMTASEFERLRSELENRLVALQASADGLSGRSDTEPVFAPAT
jgi:lysophospholipid acyltransferase (LPLAT)-like uncharacterized protein